ncbi:MAG: PQQ-binding-like beta-propeller repeat protein [Planctomycetota bacterium]|nr:PQQ-binding-like beta-propeller repeat protein [Planctomycetota bacterium]
MKRVLVFSVLAAFSPSATAGDWPTYMGDASRSGVSPDPLEPPLAEAWSFHTPLPPQPAWPDAAKWDGWHKVWGLKTRMTFDRCYHPVTAGDAVYFGSSSSDQLYCLDARSGKKRWSVFTEGPVRLAPVVHEGRVYFGSDDGLVYCVDASHGSPIWTQRPGPRERRVAGNGRLISAWPVRGGLVAFDGVLYGAAGVFPSEKVYVFALKLQDGATVWSTEMVDLPAQGYLLASASRLYVPSGRNNPMVFDRLGGKRLRVVDGQGGSYCLLAGGKRLIFGPGRTGELGLVEGERKDQLVSFKGHRMLVTPRFSYLQTDAELSSLDRPEYLRVARQRKALQSRRGRASGSLKKLGKNGARTPEARKLREEIAKIGAEIGRAEKAMTACLRWRVSCDSPDALILAGNVLYAGGEDRVTAWSAADGREIWRGRVEGRVLGLAAAGGRLYASTDRGGIHCFTEAR